MSDQFEVRWALAPPALSCTVCSAGRLNDWFTSDPEGLESLQRGRTFSRYHANQPLYAYGKPCEALYCVASGALVEERISFGRGPRRLHLVEAGDMLGWADFFGGGVHRARAVCLTEAMICAVPAAVVRGLIGKNPLLALKFLGQAVQELQPSECESLAELRAAARCRLASALQTLARHIGNGMPAGETQFTLPLSRRDLAEMIAVAPDSLSWAIHDLEEAGIARFSGRAVRIINAARLSEEIRRKDVAAA